MAKQTSSTLSIAGFLVTLTGAILFSTKAIIVKLAFAKTSIDALTLLTLRMLFSLPFYLIAAWIGSKNKKRGKFSKKQWTNIILLGLFGYYLSSLFDFVGLQYISAGLERLILFLYPTIVLLINFLFFKQKVSRIQLWAILITYIGIAFAYYGELSFDTSNRNFYFGSFLIFLCAITYATYIVGSGRIIPQVGVTKFTAYAMLASTTGVFVHFALAGSFSKLENAASYWGYGIALAVIATVIPTFLISIGMKKIGSNNVAIISGIGPVATIIQANLILGEKIFTTEIIGTIMVVIGVLFIGWKNGKNLEQT